MAEYNEYISLGNNCEVAYQFRRVLRRDVSGFFNWNVTTFPSLISLLETRFANILQIENLTNLPEKGLMHDSSHDFHVHSSFRTTDFKSEENFEERFENLKSKFAHFIDKFVADANNKTNVVYFYKTEEKDGVQQHAKVVYERLGQLHGHDNFSLVIVQKAEYREADWGESRIFNRYARRLAPWGDAPDGHVSSWDKIFREFPHKDGVTLSGY